MWPLDVEVELDECPDLGGYSRLSRQAPLFVRRQYRRPKNFTSAKTIRRSLPAPYAELTVSLARKVSRNCHH